LIECTGAPTQVAAATQSQHAVQLGQISGVIGQVRNLAMSITAASTTTTLTADEIIVETALGALRYCLANFNKTINLATTGAGGMDTGSAPANGFVTVYTGYNPTTGARTNGDLLPHRQWRQKYIEAARACWIHCDGADWCVAHEF
jgi:hypothetical protein